MKKIKHPSINALFANDKFVLVVSLLSALVIWIAVAINVSPETERVVQNVKVTLESSTSVPAQLGLSVFGEKEFYVDVTVVGKKYLVSPTALTEADIIVTAITEYVSSAGKATLELTAKPVNDNGEFEIMSISKRSIEVFYDFEKTEEYTLVPDVMLSDGVLLVDENFTSGTPVLSFQTVSITGPSTELAKIKSVVARVHISDSLKASTTLDAEVLMLNDSGKEFTTYSAVTLPGNLTLTVPVYSLKELPISVLFKNASAYYTSNPLAYTIKPTTGQFKVSVDVANTIASATIGSIDFKEISPAKSSFSFSADKLTDIIYAGSEKEFTVNIDLSDFDSAEFVVPVKNIKIINNSNNSSEPIPNGLNTAVTIVGTAESLAALTNDDVFAEIDLLSVTLERGTATFPVRVYTIDEKCWAFGSYTCQLTY